MKYSYRLFSHPLACRIQEKSKGGHSVHGIRHVIALLVLLMSSTLCMALPYRPHYQGYGTDTVGGRGGTIYIVNRLDDPYPAPDPVKGPDGYWRCTLRYALERASGPRIVLFEKSGTIYLTNGRDIRIEQNNVTIAGQSAPSPGIDIVGGGVHIHSSNTVLQHIRLRYTDLIRKDWECQMALEICGGEKNVHHVVLDHVSVAWTPYMAIGAANPCKASPIPYDISVLDSIVAFGLVKGQPYPEAAYYEGNGIGLGHSGAMPESHHYTTARNLFAHVGWRTPIPCAGRQQVFNNVTYGSSYGASVSGNDYTGYNFIQFWPEEAGRQTEVSIVNNRILHSVGTGTCADPKHHTLGTSSPAVKPLSFNVHPDSLNKVLDVWLQGNQYNGTTINDPGPADDGLTAQKTAIHWQMGVDYSSDSRLWFASEPSWSSSFKKMPVGEATTYVLAHAGARPADRDWVDTLAVQYTQAAVNNDPNIAHWGKRVHSQNEMQNPAGGPAGYQNLAENNATWSMPANPNGDSDADGYTNIEEWLEGMAQSLEGGKLPAVRK